MGNLPSGVQTIHQWQCEIKDDEIGDELLGLLHSLGTVNGFVTDLPIGIRFKERPQITSDHLAVIGYQDANRHFANHPRCQRSELVPLDAVLDVSRCFQNWAAIAPGRRYGGVIEKRPFCQQTLDAGDVKQPCCKPPIDSSSPQSPDWKLAGGISTRRPTHKPRSSRHSAVGRFLRLNSKFTFPAQ